MVKTKKESTRNDTEKKPKAKARNERAQIYSRYIRSRQFREVREIVRERQNNICPICGEEFTPDNPGVCHHKRYTWAGYGGEKEADCCVMIHQYEHTAIHRQPKSYRTYSDENPRNTPAEENMSELANAIRKKQQNKK